MKIKYQDINNHVQLRLDLTDPRFIYLDNAQLQLFLILQLHDLEEHLVFYEPSLRVGEDDGTDAFLDHPHVLLSEQE